ncbi:MAG TPA: hypothetical protein VJO52_03760 [Gemmatimonadaceae bacterium]|nr:hypothetical protein [Gemmatimonadaceae bacterium]
MTLALAIGPMMAVAPHATAQQRASAAAPSEELRDGEWISKHVEVAFDSIPSGWVVEQNVMDRAWVTLSMRGTNFYAYGGPVAPRTFASRSDPASPFYQAWFGVYVIADSAAARPDVPLQLGALDQRSWLGAMGDPQPAFTLTRTQARGTVVVAGTTHPLYTYDATTHSDLSDGASPLAQHLGMPAEATWPTGLLSFHDIALHGYYTYWYDASRRLTVIVYSGASSFDQSGTMRDNFPALDAAFLQMMRNVRLRDRAPAAD